MISVIALTIFPIPIQGLSEIGKYSQSTNNFIPFFSITDIFLNANLDISIKLKQILGNIILFIPLGFFIPQFFMKEISFKEIFLISILTSLGIEIFQVIIGIILGFNYKIFDIDDIILNTLGGILGYLFWKLIIKKTRFN